MCWLPARPNRHKGVGGAAVAARRVSCTAHVCTAPVCTARLGRLRCAACHHLAPRAALRPLRVLLRQPRPVGDPEAYAPWCRSLTAAIAGAIVGAIAGVIATGGACYGWCAALPAAPEGDARTIQMRKEGNHVAGCVRGAVLRRVVSVELWRVQQGPRRRTRGTRVGRLMAGEAPPARVEGAMPRCRSTRRVELVPVVCARGLPERDSNVRAVSTL